MSWIDKKQRLIDTKANQKATLIKLGRTPSDVWGTYADEVRALEVKSANTTGIVHSAIGNGFVSWENGAEGSLRSVTIKGCAIVESSPTPDSPVIPSFISNCKLWVYGRNLLDTSLIPFPEEGVTENIIRSDSDGSVTVVPASSSYVNTSLKLRDIAPSLRPGEIYTINVENSASLNTSYMYLVGIGSWEYGSAKTVSKDDLEATVRFYANTSGVPLTLKNLRITRGEVDAEYEPSVCGGNANIPSLLAIPGTDYADSWDAISGNGIRRIEKIVFSGDEVWTLTSPGISTASYTNLIPNWTDLYNSPPIACSHFPTLSAVEAQSYPLGISSWAGIFQFSFGNSASYSVDTWKQWLKDQAAAGTPLTVWYVTGNEVPFSTEPVSLTQRQGYACVSITGDEGVDCGISVEYLEGTGIQAVKMSEYSGSDIEIVADDPYLYMQKVVIRGDRNLQSWNIRKGITIFNKTGTAGLPVSKKDADVEYEEEFDETPSADMMVLVDDLGNITYGYFLGSWYSYRDAKYNRYVSLPGLPEDLDTNAYSKIFIWYSDLSGTAVAHLCASANTFYANDGWMCASDNEVYHYSWKSGESVWKFVSKRKSCPEMPCSQTLWANHTLGTDNKYTMYYTQDAPTLDLSGFQITSYDPVTTEFSALGWRRLSYHTTGPNAGTWTDDDFKLQASGGGNFLKNIISCTREKLYYEDVEIWPGD